MENWRVMRRIHFHCFWECARAHRENKFMKMPDQNFAKATISGDYLLKCRLNGNITFDLQIEMWRWAELCTNWKRNVNTFEHLNSRTAYRIIYFRFPEPIVVSIMRRNPHLNWKYRKTLLRFHFSTKHLILHTENSIEFHQIKSQVKLDYLSTVSFVSIWNY